jgi:Protein of unknown function (DUF2511)
MVKALGGVCVLLLFVAACGGGPSRSISAAAYGQDWPYTFSEAKVSCVNGADLIAKTDGKTYALNGAALSHAGENGWLDWREVATNNGDPGRVVGDNLDLC